MKIYGIRDGCIYEGMGTLNPMFKNKKDAEELLSWMVLERNKDWDIDDEYRWKWEREDVYTSGTDMLCISEYELK